MSQDEIYSQSDYDRFWELSPEKRSQKLQDEELSESHRAVLLFQEGLIFVQGKEYRKAILRYNKALKIKQDYADVWASRGEALRYLELYEEAIASYDKALEIEPDYQWNWYFRGNCLSELKRYEEAIASYNKVLEDDYAFFWDSRGDCLSKLKRYEAAIASYNKAIEIWTNSYSYRLKKVVIYIKTSRFIQAFITLWNLVFQTSCKYTLLFGATGGIVAYFIASYFGD